MKVLVAGATGFIGKNLVKELSKIEGCEIFCLVRSYKKAAELKPLGVKFIYADITRKHTLSKISRYKIDIIFHCAGYVGNNKEMLNRVNILGTENICELSLGLNVERMVYLSSVSVVSGNTQVPLVEDLPYKTTNIYGESKVEAEKIVLKYRKKGLKVVILRPCMVYGEDEPHMLRLICFLLKFRLIPLIDEGKKKLHLVYVKNVVEVMMASLEKEEFLKGTFFVADNEILSVKEIFDIIAKIINAPKSWNLPPLMKPILFAIPFLGKRIKFFLKDRVYSIERIKSLGLELPYSTQETLKQSLKQFSR